MTRRAFLVAREIFEFARFARRTSFPLNILLLFGSHVRFCMSVQTLSWRTPPLLAPVPKKWRRTCALASSSSRSHFEAGQILRKPFVSCICIIFTNTWPNKQTPRGTVHVHTHNQISKASLATDGH